MNMRPLGHTGLIVSEIGFGTWGIGGDAYGPTDDEESRRALERAFERGICYYDTADLYGDGHSETLLGEVFERRRDRVVIATKAGFVDRSGRQDFSPSHLRRALAGSLQRLRSDYVDVFLLHDPPIRLLEEQPDILRLLDELQRDGRVRAWGVSVRSPDDGLVAVRQFDVRVIEVNFNVTDQRARKNGLLQLCAERGVGCIVRTPLCFGFLTGLFSGDTRFAPTDHRNRWPREQRQMWADAAQAFRAAVENLHAQTPAQVALRFCLSYAGVSTVIPGMLLVAHVEENAAASAFGALSAEERRRLEEFYERQTFFWGKR